MPQIVCPSRSSNYGRNGLCSRARICTLTGCFHTGITFCLSDSWRTYRFRSCKGERPDTRLIVLAKELADLKPRMKHTSFIASSGREAKKWSTTVKIVWSRKRLKQTPVERIIAFSIVRSPMHKRCDSLLSVVLGSSCSVEATSCWMSFGL